MTLPAVAHATTAAPLAELLPARRGKPWTVGPAPYGIRNAPTSRLTDGRRALIVVEQAGRIEVYADRPNLFPVTPNAVADATDPVSVAVLATRILRSVLPMLDAEATKATIGAKGWQQVFHDKGAALTEVGFHLIDHGTHPEKVERADGPGLTWTAASGAVWGLWSYGLVGNFHLTYEGPAYGLYGVLPVLLPPLDGHTSTDAGSPFSRHLTDRFPQLRPVDADEVEFGGYREPHGWIALPSRAEFGDRADDTTRVCAEVGPIGIDLALAATAHLI
ncbi:MULTISPECIES: hypothetical protein [unclassified Streptomyces]|uniref:hypothetical protein n=1 Tax=unclassified Streptomyces TaxID=2593676 RepID=UPI002257FB14|nr:MULTISPECIES: hypothetical protein [unclassified Streptomyces]MCX4976501.1 hypothetical protein [Streptomyces sp. NBC_00620]WRZ24370.1 hypothetical protein OHT59_40580 [Streptomyces sp. NBC_00243]